MAAGTLAEGTLAVVDGRLVRARSGTGDQAIRLRAEHALLTRLAGSGVPDVVSITDDGDEVVLTTGHRPPAVRVSRALVAEAAATLAAAHAIGVVHGALRADSIGVDDGRAVVDGWTGSGTREGDVADFGDLVAPHDAALGARCTVDDAGARPSMATVAAALAPATEVRRASRAMPRRGLVAVAAAFALTTAVVVAGRSGAAPHRVTPRPVISGRGPVAGNLVAHGGATLRVGERGDVVVLGDWDCDGEATPAVLRGDHSLWVWPSWDGRPTRRDAPRRATSLRAVTRGGCDVVVPVDRSGRAVS